MKWTYVASSKTSPFKSVSPWFRPTFFMALPVWTIGSWQVCKLDWFRYVARQLDFRIMYNHVFSKKLWIILGWGREIEINFSDSIFKVSRELPRGYFPLVKFPHGKFHWGKFCRGKLPRIFFSNYFYWKNVSLLKICFFYLRGRLKQISPIDRIYLLIK